MPSRPINQQATSGPASELPSVVCTAEQVESCQQPFIHESNATGGQKRKQQRTVTNLFHPGYLPPVWKTFLRETEPRPERSRPPAFSEESCQELPPNWHPALQGFTQYNPHDPASWPCYSHSLLCATNHHHFCKQPCITYCSAYHSPPGDMVAEC